MTAAHSFRVKFTDGNGTWWTGPIRNWVDVCTLVHQQRERGIGADVFLNDGPRSREIASLWCDVEAEQTLSGQACVGILQWGCAC